MVPADSPTDPSVTNDLSTHLPVPMMRIPRCSAPPIFPPGEAPHMKHAPFAECCEAVQFFSQTPEN